MSSPSVTFDPNVVDGSHARPQRTKVTRVNAMYCKAKVQLKKTMDSRFVGFPRGKDWRHVREQNDEDEDEEEDEEEEEEYEKDRKPWTYRLVAGGIEIHMSGNDVSAYALSDLIPSRFQYRSKVYRVYVVEKKNKNAPDVDEAVLAPVAMQADSLGDEYKADERMDSDGGTTLVFTKNLF